MANSVAQPARIVVKPNRGDREQTASTQFMLESDEAVIYTHGSHVEGVKRRVGESHIMFDDDSFQATMAELRSGDEAAAAQVFKRYIRRLIALAGKQLDAQTRKRIDVEDAVLSACESFFLRARRGEFDLTGWDELWSLLAVITLRKCARRRRDLKAARRDPAREVRLQNVLADHAWQFADQTPSPLEAAILAETTEGLFRELDPADRPIVEHILQGYTAEETAARVDCSERTVRRVRTRAKRLLERLVLLEGSEP
jgi:RNA polymerase sigma-70 factor (ECF subfamily)